jgi:hypothetical protein
MAMASDPLNFTSIQEVLDFIGKEYEGDPCDAITALQTAVFHQRTRKGGKVLLSEMIGLEFFTEALPTTEKDMKEFEGTKYTAISEVMMFAFPVLCERLLASALYMMKDPRDELELKTNALGEILNWGKIRKLSILDNSADSYKIEFAYEPNRYIAHFNLTEESGFCIRICRKKETKQQGDCCKVTYK